MLEHIFENEFYVKKNFINRVFIVLIWMYIPERDYIVIILLQKGKRRVSSYVQFDLM